MNDHCKSFDRQVAKYILACKVNISAPTVALFRISNAFIPCTAITSKNANLRQQILQPINVKSNLPVSPCHELPWRLWKPWQQITLDPPSDKREEKEKETEIIQILGATVDSK